MLDFTPSKYKKLLTALQKAGYGFLTFEDYCLKYANGKEVQAKDKIVILRHDVDKKPKNSLKLAQIEALLGVKATYFFRIVAESNQPVYILQIAALGHEIAYHYEDLSIANGDVEKAYTSYVKNLEYFRQFYDVKTISMHGSPTSKFDNRDVWKAYNYKDLGIVGEPYFDFIDETVNDVNGKKFYFTDTGGMWDGDKYNVRDKAIGKNNSQKLSVHTTLDLINFISSNDGVEMVMINTHPQRWIENRLLWMIEFVVQRFKNIIKWMIVK